MGKIILYSADVKIDLKDRTSVKQLIIDLFKKEQVNLNRLNYIFCSDKYLLKINQQYLGHDTLTDIITFPLSQIGEPIIAEIYVSIERIKENAKTYKVSYQNELLRVMIHGALHLSGYKDKLKPEQLQMRSKEDYYLNYFKVSRETIN
jgi:rRNA maturation RNase YbeY